MIKENATKGSWMWQKLLKYRELEKPLHKAEIRDGKTISFWFDHWSNLGCLYDVMGHRWAIDMGISISATMAKVFDRHRRRNHRAAYLITIEEAIEKAKKKGRQGKMSQFGNPRMILSNIDLWKKKPLGISLGQSDPLIPGTRECGSQMQLLNTHLFYG